MKFIKYLINYRFVIFLILTNIILQPFLKAQEMSSEDSITLYERAKAKYEAYEKKHGNYIQTPNVNMHYLKWENSGGIPLIWSHGTWSSSYEIIQIVDQLVNIGFEVYAIDYYAHGKTPLPSNKDISIYHVADDIKFLMDSLKIEKAVIGGWSRGGDISTVFYNSYKQNTLAIICEDGGTFYGNAYLEIQSDSTLEVIKNQGNKSIEIKKKLNVGFKTEVKAFYHVISSQQYLKDHMLKEDYFMSFNWIKKTKGAVTYETSFPKVAELLGYDSLYVDKLIRPSLGLTMFEWSMLYNPAIIFRNLSIPLLIFDPYPELVDLNTELKTIYIRKSNENRTLKNRFSNLVTYNPYEDTGHGVHYEKPEQFLKDVSEFLEKVRTHHNIK